MTRTTHPGAAALLLAAACGLAAAGQARAEALQVALYPPYQWRPADASIEGLRLNIYGRNVNLTGIDFGLVNQLTGSCTGLQIGGANICAGSLTGIQSAWLYSRTGDRVTGLQGGAITINGSITGIQSGFVNLAGTVEGIQLGLFNQCSSLRGLQIGLLNQDLSNQKWPLLPLARWAF